MSRSRAYRALVGLLSVLTVSGLFAQINEPNWTNAWPHDSLPVAVGDTLELQWAERSTPTHSFELQDGILLRNNPYAQNGSTLPQDVHVVLHVKGTTNSDHGVYNAAFDKDTLMVLDLRVGMRGASLYPTGLDSALAMEDKAAHVFYDMHALMAKVASVEVNDGNGWQPVSALPLGLTVEMWINWTQTPGPNLNHSPSGLTSTYIACTDDYPASATNAVELELSWNLLPGMEEYDLEWTWVDSYLDNHGVVGTQGDLTLIPYDLDNDATRITTPELSYRIPLLYDHGYIIWRVRGSVHSYLSPYPWVHSAWAGAAPAGSVHDAVALTFPVAVEVPAHQVTKNWQASSSFAEEGKHKEVVTYADGSSRARQVVTRNNTVKVPIVGETIYDVTGRPAAQVMPVPYLKDGCPGNADLLAPITYFPDFNMVDGPDEGTAFTWADLIGSGCEVSGPLLDSLAGAQFYYSGEYAGSVNPLVAPPSFLPRAEGKPYSQTEYTRDNTGRIKAQGGVGPAFQIGEHDTKYFYGTPAQIELDRLFGSEAGYAQHYQKNVTTDPNGQVSVTYLDMAGRTVATALACDAPPGMEEVGNASVILTTDLFNGLASTDTSIQLRVDGPGLLFTKQLAVDCDGSYTFDYSLTPEILSDNCWTDYCPHCVYDLEVKVVDDCGVLRYADVETVGAVETNCQTSVATVTLPEPHTFLLEAGEYTITKVLRVNEDARDQYVADLVSGEYGCVQTYDDFRDRAWADIDRSSCKVTCEDCYEEIGSLDYFVDHGGTPEGYDVALAQCDDLCKAISWCDIALENMMVDVSPGGQYGETETIDVGGFPVFVATDPVSVYNGDHDFNRLYQPFLTASTEEWRQVDLGPLWRQPLMETGFGWVAEYRETSGLRNTIPLVDNEDGTFTPDVVDATENGVFVIDGFPYTYPENLADVNDFLHNWHMGWERSLVRFHPEYCYYRDCKGYSVKQQVADQYISSDGYDQRLMEAITYADAVFTDLDHPPALFTPNGLPTPFNFLTQDPFMTQGGVYADALENKVANYFTYNGIPYSMMNIAAAMAQCGGNVTGGPTCTDFPTVGLVADAAWANLRSMYHSEKYKAQKAKADAYVSNCGCAAMNVCIGETSTSTWWSRMHAPMPSLSSFWQGNFMDWSAYIQAYNTAWASQPGVQHCQPCSQWHSHFFQDKVRRVADPGLIPGTSTNPMDAAYQVFQITGQCPMATAWQVFFQQMLPSGIALNTPFSLTDDLGWKAVYSALAGYDAAAPVPIANGTFILNGNTLTFTIQYDDGTPNCVITITDPGPIAPETAPLDWQHITMVAQLNATMPNGTFDLGIYFSDADGVSHTRLLHGAGMCHELAPCNFPPSCEPNEIAVQFQDLFNVLTVLHLSTSAPVNLAQVAAPGGGTDVIQGFLSENILALYPDNSLLVWSFVAPDEIRLTRQGSSIGIVLDQLQVQGCSSVQQCLEDAVLFQNIDCAFANNFTIEAVNSGGDVFCTLTGAAWTTEAESMEPLLFGECELPLPTSCQGTDYANGTDLAAVLADWVPGHYGAFVGTSLWESAGMTNTLGASLCPNCEVGDWSPLDVTVDDNIVSIGACLDLQFEFINNSNTTFTSLGPVEYPAPSQQDESGAYHSLKFSLKNGNAVVGTLFVTANCLNFLVCEECPLVVTEGPGGVGSTTPGTPWEGLSMMELIDQGFVVVDKEWPGYITYTNAVANLNYRLGLSATDTAYVKAADYSEYRKLGMQHALTTYLRYIQNFRPELDRSILLKSSAKFSADYGNSIDVKKEYERYMAVVDDYNHRADLIGKPHVEYIDIDEFKEMLAADKVPAYIENLLEMPVLDSPPLGLVDFNDINNINTPNNGCAQLYKYSYLPAYSYFELHNRDSAARCPDYLKYSPLVSFKDFKKSNLCCSDSGLAIFTGYIEKLYNDTLKCPGVLPWLKECPDPLETAKIEVDKDCQRIYSLWVDALTAYDQSVFHQSTGIDLHFDEITFDRFVMEGWCECGKSYANYLQQFISWVPPLPKPEPPMHYKDFCAKRCEESYYEWKKAMDEYNGSCEYVQVTHNYLPIGELEDYGAFKEAYLCECVEAYMVYLQPYLQWSSQYPMPGDAAVSIEDFCAGKIPNCCVLFDQIRYALHYTYPGTDYWEATHKEIFFPFENCTDVEKKGYCDCLSAYWAYLQTYFTWVHENGGEPPPEPLDFEKFCTTPSTPNADCSEEYNTYHNGLIALTDELVYLNAHCAGSGPLSFIEATPELFSTYGLCFCVEGYLANLEFVLQQATTSGDCGPVIQDKGVLSILQYCHPPTPCPPAALLPVIATIPIPDDPCPCCTQLETAAIIGAGVLYGQYLDSLTEAVTASYDSTCLSAAETFTMEFTNTEHHYTLYYYDQAGNLVRTVPPEGVQPLAITEPTDADAISIKQDRENGTRTLFTDHRMASDHLYNSLGQPTRTAMPDQDRMPIWETGATSGLLDDLKITGSWFGEGGLGYLTGYRTGVLDRGYVYRSTDGGDTWQRSNGLLGVDLLDIHYPEGQTGFAVGGHGAIVRTVDGGASWDMLTNEVLGTGIDLTAVAFKDAMNGVVVGPDFSAYTSNAGTAFNFGTPNNAPNFKGVGFDGTNYQAVVSSSTDSPTNGSVYTSTNGNAWNVAGSFGSLQADLTCLAPFGSSGLRAAGAHGILLEKDMTPASDWRMLPTGTTDNFKALAFLDAQHGVAIMDSLRDDLTWAGVLRYTNDFGATWSAIGRPEFDLNTLVEYERSGTNLSLVAVGRGAGVVRILLSTENVGVIPMTGNLPTTAILTAVWAHGMPDGLRCIVGTSTGEVYATLYLGPGQMAGWSLYPANSTPNPAVTCIVAQPATGPPHSALGSIVLANGAKSELNWDLTELNVALNDPLNYSGTNARIAAVTSTTDVLVYNSNGATDQRLTAGGSPPGITTTSVTNAGTLPSQAPTALVNSDGKLWSVGAGGELFQGTLAANTLTWVDKSSRIRPLPLRGIDKRGGVAVGDQGLLYVQNGTDWRAYPTGHTAQLNAVCVDNGLAAVAGEGGTAFTFPLATPEQTQDIDVPVTGDLYAVALHGTQLKLGGDAGLVLNTTDLVNAAPMPLPPNNAGAVRAFGYSPSYNLLTAVGDGSLVHHFIGSTRMVVQDVFVPRLNGVSFATGGNGYVVGAAQTARHTTDGGAHWRTVPMPTQSAEPDLSFNAVKAVALNKAIAVGNAGLAAEFTGNDWDAVTITAGTADLNAVAVAENGAGVIVGTSGYFTRNANETNWGSATSAGYPLHAVWNFPRLGTKDEFIIGGDAGFVSRLQFPSGSYSNQPDPASLPSTYNIRAFWFHDHVSGFALCDDNTVIPTLGNATSVDHSGFVWNTVGLPTPILNMQDGLGQSLADMRPTTIGFSDRHHGFIGGYYNGTPQCYARTLVDENDLYSQRFWYDALGRIVLSQNSKQFNAQPQRFSYSLYDALGRVFEAGEIDDDIAPRFAVIQGALVGGMPTPSVLDPVAVKNWVEQHNLPTDRREVTRTWYDAPMADLLLSGLNFTQENLRLRVASTTYQESYSPGPGVYDHATHYSYDIHGNVKDLVQDIPQLGVDAGQGSDYFNQRWKKLHYTYDLISGNVKQVDYYGVRSDQMHHRYTYDADNRIQTVETSADKVNWHMDAEYFYYPHGPLERVELGEPKVQGVDYAYTLQGWLKAINGDKLVPENDMGQDGMAGTANSAIARDAYGESIGYFGDADYQAIDPDRWNNDTEQRPVAPIGSEGTLYDAYNPLYNGNIAHIVNSLQPFGLWNSPTEQGQVLAQVYKYDQLNRLKQAQGVAGLTSNTWKTVNDLEANRYRSSYEYDANGNILTAKRWDGTGTQYDDLKYRYAMSEPDPAQLRQNRLYELYDQAPGTLGPDIANNPEITDPEQTGYFEPSSTTVNTDYNYGYDQLGNLTRDDREEIADIQWTVSGKVKSITRIAGSTRPEMSFGYGADGQRITKTVGDPTAGGYREYYLRDAQGNFMATYKYTNSGTASLKVTDRPIYGSKRIGSYTKPAEIAWFPIPTNYVNYVEPMSEYLLHYELNDHLGNVTAVVTGHLANGNDAGSPWQADLKTAQGYEAFGSLLPGRNYSSGSYLWGFNGQIKDDEIYGATGTSYTAEFWQYDPRVGRRWNIDPVDKAWMSPYHAFSNKPILNIDPNGANDSPVYDNTGELLGTDDEGLKGDVIVMDKKDFSQGMKHEDAKKLDQGIGKGLENSAARQKLVDTQLSLPSRPDYDGKITLDEANDWFRNGNQKPLYANLNSIDFSTTHKEDVDKLGYVNLFLTQSPISAAMDGGGNVYGSIKLQLANDLTVTAPAGYHDRYDFDQKPWGLNPGRWVRNVGTAIGKSKAGDGLPFNIFFYGTSRLSPTIPMK